MKSILFRPVYLPPDDEPRSARLLNAYRQLCTPPAGGPPWPAQNLGPGRPGPFQRGWELFVADQKVAAHSARCKTRRAAGVPTSWRITEVRERLAMLIAEDDEARAEDDEARAGGPSGPETPTPLPSVKEYVALVAMQTSANFTCIAQARAEPRQRREADDAVALPEAVVAHGGADDDGEADGHVEAAAARAEAGLGDAGRQHGDRPPL